MMYVPSKLTHPSMNPVTIRLPMRWTLTSELSISTHPTCTSKRDCSCSVTTASQPACQISRTRLCHKTCTRSSIRPQGSVLPPVPNGVYLLGPTQCSMALAQQRMAPRLIGTEDWQTYPIHKRPLSLPACTISENPFERRLLRGR